MAIDIVGLGYCGWDHLCILPVIPMDDKVQILERVEQGGGPSATAIYAAQKLGAACAFDGVVGDDAQGRQIIAAFQSVGVNTDGIRIRSDTCSPTAYCWVAKDTGKRSIAWTHGSVAPLTPDEIDFATLRNAKLLHLDGHQTIAAIEAAKFAKDNGVLVSIDAGTIVPGIEILLELADIIIASEKFIHNFCHEDDPQIASHKLFAIGSTRFAGVTVGSRGSYGFDGENDYFQPAIPVSVVDTTGAGDVYHGAFIASVVNGKPWHDCMKTAAVTAALKCTKLGGRTGIPTIQELQQALSNL
ncbi:MAG: hypothetical protein IKP58_17625 [Victivallales bacterium]|nr:hypothetical protein [Victivallales bacterium]